MMRRLIAGFLTVCMMLSICPPEAFVVHTSATDISVTEPVATEPAAEPVVTEPVAEPVVTEPVAEPVVTEPVAEPVVTEPVTEPVVTEPAPTEATEAATEATEAASEATEAAEETSEPTEPTEETTEPEQIVDYRTMTAGSTITLVASGEIGGYWSSYNPNLATVEGKIDEQGRAAAKVTGLTEGTVTVAYVLENHVEKWIITITPAPTEATEETTEATQETTEAPAEQTGTLTADRTSIHVGETATLTGTSGDWFCGYSKWSVDRPDVATVSANGVVTAASVGDVTITHEYCAKHKLLSGHSLEKETVTIHVAEALCLESLEITGAADLAQGETLQLGVTLYPQGADAELAWDSSDDRILTVDQNGLVTALEAGTAYVMVSSSDIIDYREITVTAAPDQDAEEDDLLGGLLGTLGGNTLGLVDGASTFALTAAQEIITVDKTTIVKGTQSKCGFSEWGVDKEGVVSWSGDGNEITVAGVSEGKVTITHTYCTRWTNQHESHNKKLKQLPSRLCQSWRA